MGAPRLEKLNDIVGMIMSEGGLTPQDLVVLMADSLADVPAHQVPVRLLALRAKVDTIRESLLSELAQESLSCDCPDCSALRARAQEAAFRQTQQAVTIRARGRGPVGEA
jgi:hypothetical protein